MKKLGALFSAIKKKWSHMIWPELAYSEQDLTPPECPKSNTPVCLVQFYGKIKKNLKYFFFLFSYSLHPFFGLLIIVFFEFHIFLSTPEIHTNSSFAFIG